ncbi:MFS transporter [Clostridium malenominatum]|uniref:MFS transporter n=1 Tax=Clostridium malenominatum TaxID=1539 RepID=A0ABN1IQW6_9CLOT
MRAINVERSNFILFSLGKFISIFGASIYTFAMGLYVLKITGSGLNFATNLILSIIPMIIINPIAGVMADRLDKKKLVVLMDLANGTLLLGLYVLSSMYGLKINMIYASTFIMTIFTTIFGISFETAKPNIVSDKRLMSINSISKIIDSTSSILGPMIGGIVFSFMDIKFFIIFNGVCFILSGVSEIFIDFNFNCKNLDERIEKVNLFSDIVEGFKYMRERRSLVSLFIIFISLNFFMGLSISIPLPFILNNVLNFTSKYYGISQGALPIGMILGAVFVKGVSEKYPYRQILMMTSIVLSICMILIGLPTLVINIQFSSRIYLIYYCTILMFTGIAISLIDIPLMYMLQRIITDEYRGRVLSLGISIAKIILPVALIISGLLVNSIPTYVLTFTGGILLSVIIIFVLRVNNSLKDFTLEQ